MNLESLLKLAQDALVDARAPFGVIGAFGMSAHGYQRATNDIDFLVDGSYKAQVRAAFESRGFSVFHQTDEVLQLQGPGPIDILYANRPLWTCAHRYARGSPATETHRWTLCRQSDGG